MTACTCFARRLADCLFDTFRDAKPCAQDYLLLGAATDARWYSLIGKFLVVESLCRDSFEFGVSTRFLVFTTHQSVGKDRCCAKLHIMTALVLCANANALAFQCDTFQEKQLLPARLWQVCPLLWSREGVCIRSHFNAAHSLQFVWDIESVPSSARNFMCSCFVRLPRRLHMHHIAALSSLIRLLKHRDSSCLTGNSRRDVELSDFARPEYYVIASFFVSWFNHMTATC